MTSQLLCFWERRTPRPNVLDLNAIVTDETGSTTRAKETETELLERLGERQEASLVVDREKSWGERVSSCYQRQGMLHSSCACQRGLTDGGRHGVGGVGGVVESSTKSHLGPILRSEPIRPYCWASSSSFQKSQKKSGLFMTCYLFSQPNGWPRSDTGTFAICVWLARLSSS